MVKRIVPDTSVLVDGRITRLIDEQEFKFPHVVVPNAVVSELEHQANRGRETGLAGLSELKKLQEQKKQGLIELEFFGEKTTLEDVKLGRVDQIVRSVAFEKKASLVTSDRVQSEVAKAMGLDLVFLEAEVREKKKPSFFKYFDENTLSVHLKENVLPLAKKGGPGNWVLEQIGEKKLSRVTLKELAKEIVEDAERAPDAFIEIDAEGATVVQYGVYRIAITKPPFSDAWEITLVRPLVKLSLSEYSVSQKLLKRVQESAEGIIVAGPPGHGKSTFATALAEYYESLGKVVKTMESPRDLQVRESITQYAPLEGSFEKTSDILLLVRPDYTVYDEMRKTEDFRIYADMRLAGVGMIGVVHATRAIDAVQRFIGRVELGMLPEIVDTVVYIKNGKVRDVYELRLLVKVPSGMMEQDLARPVVEVYNFENNALEYEAYTFGDQTVVIPVRSSSSGSKDYGQSVRYRMGHKYVTIFAGRENANKRLQFKAGRLVFSAPANHVGEVSVSKKQRLGKKLSFELRKGSGLEIV